MKRKKRRWAKRNVWDRSPFGLGVVGLLVVGTAIVAAVAYKNMSEKDKAKALPL